MLRLPEKLEVQIESSPKSVADVSRLLVALEFRYADQYYFGAILGITDEHGRCTFDRRHISDEFRESQRLFPMDYSIELENCDERVDVVVSGGAAFLTERAAALASPFLTPENRRIWELARNQHVRPSRTSILLGARLLKVRHGIVVTPAT